MPTSNDKFTTRARFLNRLRTDRADVVDVAASIFAWASARGVKVDCTTAPDLDSAMGRRMLGVQEHKIFTLQTNGLIWILFRELASRFPSRDQELKHRVLGELEQRLALVAGGASAPGSYGTQAAWRLDALDTSGFLDILGWLLEELEKSYRASLRRS